MSNEKLALYIITNKRDGVLYIGITERIKTRIGQHKRNDHPNTFSARYNLDKLIYFEFFPTKEAMLTRERQMKKWKREWKIRLIEDMNPKWEDLYDKI